ncbi:hypothetical protein AVEN_77888-1 [Araneus ventricosus]|uniref:Uncharacterized protein n=1 Tax=Araneus ventricosus TaxID=182803 RepID=A0A4Y2QZD7_ARAVE|nr:hypothetical protein AVEN_77888-1 [Araneus ventricosus]
MFGFYFFSPSFPGSGKGNDWIPFIAIVVLFSFRTAVTEFLQKDKLMIFFPVSFVELAFQGALLFIKAPLSLRTGRNGHEDLNAALSAPDAPLRLAMNLAF